MQATSGRVFSFLGFALLGFVAVVLALNAIVAEALPLYAQGAEPTPVRLSAQDFDTLSAAGNNNITGMWSDGTTMWVVDARDDKLYAYDLDTKQHDSTMDIELHANTVMPEASGQMALRYGLLTEIRTRYSRII